MFRHDLRQKGGKASSTYCSWGTTHLTKAKAATRALSLSRNRSRNAATKSTVGPSEHKSQKRFRRNRRRKVGGVHDLDGRALTSCNNSRKSYGVKWGKKEIARSEASEWSARLLVDILGTSTQEKSERNFRREKKTIWSTLYFVSFRYVKNIDDVVFHSFPLDEAFCGTSPALFVFHIRGEKKRTTRNPLQWSEIEPVWLRDDIIKKTPAGLLSRPCLPKPTKPKPPKNGYIKISQQLTSVWWLFKVEMNRRIFGR